MPPESVVTELSVPPLVRESSKVSSYSPMTVPGVAVSISVMVQVFEVPVAGIVGVKVTCTFSDTPRLS